MNVLVQPHVSEKAATVGEKANQYVFRVLEDASKLSAAEAVLVTLHREDRAQASVTEELADFYARHGRMKESLAVRRTESTKKLRPLQPSRR